MFWTCLRNSDISAEETKRRETQKEKKKENKTYNVVRADKLSIEEGNVPLRLLADMSLHKDNRSLKQPTQVYKKIKIKDKRTDWSAQQGFETHQVTLLRVYYHSKTCKTKR